MDEHLTDDSLPATEEIASTFSRGYTTPQSNGEASDDDIPDGTGPEPTPFDDLPELVQKRVEAAAAFFRAGWPVIKLRAGSKRPVSNGFGQHWVFRTEDDLRRELSTPVAPDTYANFGLRGGAHGLIVDQDNGLKKEADGNERQRVGKVNLLRLIAENGGEWPDTLKVRTPSSGRHDYLNVPERVSTKHADDIDWIGGNNYAVGPWCELIEGRCDEKDTPGVYTVEAGSIAKIANAPAWIAKVVSKAREHPDLSDKPPLVEWDHPESIEAAREFILSYPTAVEGDNGDYRTFMLFKDLGDFGISMKKAIELVLEPRQEWEGDEEGDSWNSRCSPPWETDQTAVPGRQTLEDKAESAYKKRNRRFGEKSPAFKARLYEQASGGAGNGSPDAQTTEPGIIPEGFASFQEFAAMPAVRSYVIQDFFLTRGLAYMVARRGTGKTTVALDIACHIACERSWHQREVKTGWRVVYLCLEDDVGLRLNMRAWAQEHGQEPEDHRFIASASFGRLTDLDKVKELAANLKAWAGDDPVAVILDTWQRATSGWSKNDHEHMEAAVERAEYIASEVNGPLLALVHPPKDAKVLSVKGAGEQEDASAALYHLETLPDDHLKLLVERLKGPGEGDVFYFKRRVAVLPGKDDFGLPLTGLVVDHIERGNGRAIEAAKPSERQAERLDEQNALVVAVAEELMKDAEMSPDEPVDFSVRDMANKLSSDIAAPVHPNLDGKSKSTFQNRLGEIYLPKDPDTGKVIETSRTGRVSTGELVRTWAEHSTPRGQQGGRPGWYLKHEIVEDRPQGNARPTAS